MSLDDLLGLIDDRDASWMPQAACKGMDPNLFFAGPGEDVDQARHVCWECPVIEQCRDYGIDEKFGVWGGLSGKERRQLRFGRRPLPDINHGTNGGYMAHLRRGERPCDTCRAAHQADKSERRSKAIQCGTRAGYDKHRRNGEEACDACLAANVVKTMAQRQAARLKAIEDIHTAHLRQGCDCLATGAVVDVMRECCVSACRCHRTLLVVDGAA